MIHTKRYKREITLLFLLLPLFANLIAQNKPNDAVMRKVDSLLILSNQHTKNVNVDLGLNYSLEALKLSQEVSYPIGIAKSYLYIGNSLFYLGNYEKILEYLFLAEAVKHKDFNLYLDIKRAKGRTYTNLGLYETSLNEFTQVLSEVHKVKGKVNRELLWAQVNEDVAYLYDKMGQSDSALYYIRKSRETLLSMDESLVYANLINSCSLLVKNYIVEEKFDSAAYCMEETFQLAEKYEYLCRSQYFIYLGDMEVKKGDFDSALNYYLQALDAVELTKYIENYSVVYKRLSEAYKFLNNDQKSQMYIEKMLLAENELSIKKMNSTEIALDVLLAEQKKIETRRFRIILIWVVSIISLSSLLVFLSYKSRKRKSLNAKSNEIEMLKAKLNVSFDEIIELAKTNSPHFLARFQEAYPKFVFNMQQSHPDITNSELTFCAMVFLNFSSKEIAEYTFVEHRSVQTRKGRLRKRLNLPRGDDLNRYFDSLS